MEVTFEKMPAAIALLHSKLEHIERLLEEKSALNQEDKDQIFTVAQAAQFLNITPQTVYGLVNKSLIPYSKPSKRLYFSRQELTEWIKSNRRKTASEIRDAAGNYSPSPKR